MTTSIFRQGEIYLANLNPTKWNEQQGIRPIVINFWE